MLGTGGAVSFLDMMSAMWSMAYWQYLVALALTLRNGAHF